MTPQEFLSQMARTANMHNFDEHMNLISKDVKVYGVPDFDLITYDDWFNQCKQEFEDKLLTDVSYQDVHILSETTDEITFVAVETVEASDGKKNVNCVKFVIKKETDGQWRVVLERIMSEAELGNTGNSLIQ